MSEVNMRELLEQATMFVGINKITRKNAKLFNKRLILKKIRLYKISLILASRQIKLKN